LTKSECGAVLVLVLVLSKKLRMLAATAAAAAAAVDAYTFMELVEYQLDDR